MSFNVGDRVRVKDNCGCRMEGEEVIITNISDNYGYDFTNDDGASCCEEETYLEDLPGKIQVGDLVILSTGSTTMKVVVISDCSGGNKDEYDYYVENGYYFHLDQLEKVGAAASPGTINKLNEEPQDMSAIDTLKSAKLDQTTRALRAEMLEENNGNVTSYGIALMNQKNWEANRAAYAKELIAAKKTIANEQLAYNKSVSADEDDE